MYDFVKLSLSVKPPLKNIRFSHIMKFLKSYICGGGITLVPRYNIQPSFHQGLPAKHTQTIIVVRKSSTP